MAIFKGSGVAICTPMTDEGVNIPVFQKMLNFHVDNGTDAVIVCGTTGEPPTMTEEEKISAIECAIKTIDGRIPVVVGSGGNNTAKVIADSQRAQKMGADALLIVTPYYNKATQGGLVQHYNKVADSVDLPIIIYNVPGRTGLNMTPDTLAQLVTHPNLVAMKEASGNIGQVMKMARLIGPGFDLYSGNDDQILPLLAAGGVGVISVVANIAPRQTHDIVAKYLAGDVEGSRQLQLDMLPLIDSLFTEVNPIPAKAALTLLGYEMGIPRLPLTPLTAGNLERLRKDMENFGLL